MNVIDGQAGLVIYSSLIFYSLTIDNILNIVVLLILAGITITLLFGNNGIITKASDAKEKTESAMLEEQSGINTLTDQMAQALGEDTSSLAKLIKAGTRVTEKTTVTDRLGNSVVIPAGFSVTSEGATVQDGVVIEDSAGNQFVWIPVGVVTKNDGTQSNEIVLGRYTFARTKNAETGLYEDGTPTLVQAAYTDENPTNYTNTVTIPSYYQELSTARDGVASSGTDGLNATAKDLAGFVDSVKTNGGYYLARYEASYGSGSSTSNWKPLSQPSIAYSTSSMSYTSGTLWNFITQLNAAKVARNMYAGNIDINENSVGVESDLVNSYAWDTAIVYIQEMGHTNYANANSDTTGNTSLMNTGKTGDVVCNIYDMAANTKEWTTEYSTDALRPYAYPCVYRGGVCSNSSNYTAYRYDVNATDSYYYISFRVALYVNR